MRGGSKEVPNKNLTIINNKPLLAYTIEQAIKCNLFTKIIVSTDSKKHLEAQGFSPVAKNTFC